MQHSDLEALIGAQVDGWFVVQTDAEDVLRSSWPQSDGERAEAIDQAFEGWRWLECESRNPLPWVEEEVDEALRLGRISSPQLPDRDEEGHTFRS